MSPGIPFLDANTQNVSLGIMEHGQAILGDNLLGLQAGNEPDLYAAHDHRPAVRSSTLNETLILIPLRITHSSTTLERLEI